MTQGPDASRATDGSAPSAAAETERGDPALIGRTVSGKYKIEKFLGGGAMGAVYKARFAALEKNVAVKVMHRAIAVDPNFVGRFHREAKAASRLDHPNSMRVIDFGEEPDGLLYIAMEYVEGRDLYRVIHEDWPISNADLADMLMQALAAIAVAHEMGVIHRDLKPENLMILRAKNDEERDAYLVKVCDFGIAKITEKDDESSEGGRPGQKLTTQGLVVGTPEYMSPEQARGEKLDARSDIYSMGVILYQLLTGRTPFTADTPLAVVLKHITENPQPPSVHYAGVHKGLEAVCLKALAKDRNDRFQTARAMRNALREALEGRPMPVADAAATTALAMSTTTGAAGPAAGSGPVAVATAGGRTAQGVSGPVAAAVEGAPTAGGPAPVSHGTPLGTAAAATAPRASRTGLVVGLGVGALLLAGAAVGVLRFLDHDRTRTSQATPVDPPPTSTPVATAPGSVAAALPAVPTATITADPAPSGTTDPKTGKRMVTAAPSSHVVASAKAPEAPLVPAGATPPAPPIAVASVVEPAPPPVTAAPPPPPPQAVAPVAPAAPAFNAQTCRVSVGAPRTTGATSSRDLTLNNTAGTWTQCAQRSIKDRPSGPVSATVHLNFSDKGKFQRATCAGCPGPLAACIQSTTPPAAMNIRGGDITGEPSFDVPLALTCD